MKYLLITVLLLYVGIRFYKSILKYAHLFKGIFTPTQPIAYSKSKQEEKVSIDYIPETELEKHRRSQRFDYGEYTDYEEIK